MITVITHENPDTDALFSVAAVVYLTTGAEHTVIFDSKPEARQHDGRTTFIVDVARTPMDHHQLEEPRSTCAFVLVCEHFITHGTDEQKIHARAILERIGPAVLRQDSTGSIDPEREPTVNALGMPRIINSLVWKEQNDNRVWQKLWPIIQLLFDDQVAIYEAEHHPDRVLKKATITPSKDGHVIGVKTTRTIGEVSPLQHVSMTIERAYPSCILQVYVTRWKKDGNITTISRGVGRRAGTKTSVRDLIAQVKDELPENVKKEINSWHHEEFFCGAGSNKFPRQDEPPDNLIRTLVPALEEALK